MTACPVCFESRFEDRRLTSEIFVRTCERCGLLLSRIERSGPVVPEFAGIDDRAYHRSIGKVRQLQAKEILAFIARHGPARGDWLDIGCGFGYLLAEARRAGYRIFGVEPDEKAYAAARELFGEDCLHQGLMLDDTRPDKSADIVSTLDVLEHIPTSELSDFASMVRRKLRPGGLWVIKLPSTDGLYYKLAHGLLPISENLVSGTVKRLWQSEYEFPHTVYFNERTLSRFLQNHELQILGSRYLTEVTVDTVLDRLTMDGAIPRRRAYLIAPFLLLIGLIERLRRKSDALLMISREPDR